MAAAIDGQARAEQATLIARVGHGDLDAFRDIAELYARPMHRLAWRMLLDADDAEHVVREVFVRLWAAAPRWRNGDGRIGGWLYRCCTKLCLDRLRISGEREPVFHLDPAMDCLAALGGQARAAIVLTRCDALPNADVADILGMRLTPFESILSDARTALLACLRRSMTRVDSLNQMLDEIRPAPLPADFAARIAAQAAAPPPPSRRKTFRDRRVACLRHPRALTSAAATGLFAVSAIAAMLANGEFRGPPPLAATIERMADSTSKPEAPPARPAVTVIVPPPLPSPALDAAPAAAQVAAQLASSAPMRPLLKSHRPAHRLALASVPKGKLRKARRSGEPIPLLPPGFSDASPERLARADEPAPALAEAPRRPAVTSYAELAAERRARMREYLRGLSPDELKQLRREERALRRERKRAERNGFAQIWSDRR